MRPDSSPDPAIETLEELSDVGAFVILAPTSYERVQFRNQLLGVQRSLEEFGSDFRGVSRCFANQRLKSATSRICASAVGVA